MRDFDRIIRKMEPAWRRKWLPEDAAFAIGHLAYKPIGQDLASVIGLDIPEVYSTGCTLDEAIGIIAQRREAVIKPVREASSRGVMLLSSENGALFDVLRQEQIELEEVKQRLADVRDKRGLKDKWVVEELLWPASGERRPIDDLKIYCFYGDPICILHRSNSSDGSRWQTRFRWYDAEWSSVDVGKYNDRFDEDLSPPKNAHEVLRVAVEASRSLPVPFMRIDLYAATRGVVFGEFTRAPGNRSNRKGFSPDWQERLVTAWDEAKERLEADMKTDRMQRIVSLCSEVGRRHQA